MSKPVKAGRRLQWEIVSWCDRVNPDRPGQLTVDRPYIQWQPEVWQDG